MTDCVKSNKSQHRLRVPFLKRDSFMNIEDQKREIEELAKMRQQHVEQLRKLWSKYEELEAVVQAAERNESVSIEKRQSRNPK